MVISLVPLLPSVPIAANQAPPSEAIGTRDIDTATEFYEGVLGLTRSKQWGKMPAIEFETGKLAQQQANDPMIKQFANQLVTDHQKTTNELKALVEGGKVKVKAKVTYVPDGGDVVAGGHGGPSRT